MTRVSDAQWKYWKNSLLAYLQGKKTMNWIVGVLDVGSLSELDQLIKEVKEYMTFPKHDDIPELRRRVMTKQNLE